jgi:undecaprenyl-diphosphatase
MILLDELVQLDVTARFRELFLVAIQLGAVLSVAVTYFRRLIPLPGKRSQVTLRDAAPLWAKIIIACLPAAVVGILFDDRLDALFYNYQTVAAALIVYGVIFIVFERKNSRAPKITSVADMPYRAALFIGLFQLLSLIPGTSRSGATILGAMLLGASRTVATEFTFFLALPVMLGASLLKLMKFGLHFTGYELTILLTGALTAFLLSLAAIRFLVGYVKKHDFTSFGWYRIALGVAVIAYFALAA